MEQLQGKVTLVTGGGRGLGEAICRTLAEAGATVIAADIRTDLVDRVVSDICAQGGQAHAMHLDITDEQGIRRAIEEIVAEHGRLDVLVNNAGADVTIAADELDVEDWDRVVAVNLRAPFVLSKYAIPEMRKQGKGHIVNIASTAAKRAWPNASVYHATKWGLLGLSHALHAELRSQGIKVTAVVAGGMRTPFLLDRFPDIDLNNLQDPKNVAQTVRFALTMPDESVIPELMVIPMRETSWP